MNIKDYYLWTALITPFLENGEIDFESLTKIFLEQDEAKNGILILGSTAEALNLRLEEKKKIINHILKIKRTSPIMVGVGGHQIDETLEWVNYLEQFNIEALLMVTPIYAKPGAVGQYNWFKKLMDATTKPVMLYNVPGRTAVALSYEAVKKLSEHKNFWSIKEASGSVEKFCEYKKSANGKSVYCGDDAMMSDFAENGSVGLVSVASNAWPKETNLYVKKCLQKKLIEKELWANASNSLFIASNPIPVKRLMFENGKIKTPNLIPPLSKDDLNDIAKILNLDVEIKNWYERNKNELE